MSKTYINGVQADLFVADCAQGATASYVASVIKILITYAGFFENLFEHCAGQTVRQITLIAVVLDNNALVQVKNSLKTEYDPKNFEF